MDKRIIQKLIEKEVFLPIDLYFAKVFSSENSPFTLLFCYLFAMARQGHLCIKVKQNQVVPSPSLFCEEEALYIEEAICNCFDQIPLNLCKKVSSQQEIPNTPFCMFGKELYLHKNWLLQQEFMRHIQRLRETKPLLTLNRTHAEDPLNKEQKNALEKALSSPISLISGGPGTGKTFTAAYIVRTFYDSLSEEEKKTVTIKLAAPTGKAAALLEKNLRLDSLEGISCSTLHSLIQNRQGFRQTLYADLLLIDEASMLDARLFVQLLQSLQGGGRVVLMGDRDQLPPVEAGGFFADLIDKSQQWQIPVTLLQKSLRMEKGILQTISEGILFEDIEKIKQAQEVHLLSSLKDISLKKQIEEGCQRHFFIQSHEGIDYKMVLQSMEKFRILSPLRKGPLGVDALNQMALRKYQEQQPTDGKLICPILITKNDPGKNLMNGDTGVLVAKSQSWKKGVFTSEDRAYFLSKDQLVEMPGSLLPSFSLAYALSIHKSQGSEYESVLVILPPGSERFGKEVLYTAVTRAKKELSLWAEEKTLQAVLQKSSRKISGFSCDGKRFYGIVSPSII